MNNMEVMNYDEFKEYVIEHLMEYISDEHKSFELVVDSVYKPNCTLDCIALRDTSNRVMVSPTIYINAMYMDYSEHSDSMVDVLKGYADMMEQAFNFPIAKIDFSSAKDNLVMELVNTDANKEMLAGIPHRRFEDLSIIYKWVLSNDENGIQSALVTNGLADLIGLSEEDIYKLAYENTRKVYPVDVFDFSDVAEEIYLGQGMPSEMLDELGDYLDNFAMPGDVMWVMSNKPRIGGSVSMVYEDELYALSCKLNDDLWVLPSSRHEVFCVRAGSFDSADVLREMVCEVNDTGVSLEDKLSDSVYYYSRADRKLSVVE